MRVLTTDQPVPFCPAALTSGRLFRGLTRTALAERSGLSRQQVHNLERGDIKAPPPVTVHALSAALELPVSYLGHQPGPLPARESIHCRGLAQRPDKVIDESRVRGEHFARFVTRLTAHARPRTVGLPEHPENGISELEAIAERVRVQWGLRTDNPIASMTRLLERAGAFVGLFDSEDPSVEAFSWWAPGPLVLCRNSNDSSATRRRFSLAHELGHLILHRGRGSGSRDLENAANHFASAFLLPRSALFREFPRSGSRIDWDGLIAMKTRWGVSIQAILFRAQEAGLIPPSAYRSAYVRISQLGWRKNEPGEPALEKPELAQNIVSSLNARGFTKQALARDLGFDVKLLEETAGVPLHDDGGARSGNGTILEFPKRWML